LYSTAVSRLAAACALLIAGCSATAEVVLVLEDEDGDCDQEALAGLTWLSVEVWGVVGQQNCVLKQRCVRLPGAPGSLEDLADALRAQVPPLVDVDSGAAERVVLHGHTDFCLSSDDVALCGLADLANVDRGELVIELDCGLCQETGPELCP
jgi:hypothetical protein